MFVIQQHQQHKVLKTKEPSPDKHTQHTAQPPVNTSSISQINSSRAAASTVHSKSAAITCPTATVPQRSSTMSNNTAATSTTIPIATAAVPTIHQHQQTQEQTAAPAASHQPPPHLPSSVSSVLPRPPKSANTSNALPSHHIPTSNEPCKHAAAGCCSTATHDPSALKAPTATN